MYLETETTDCELQPNNHQTWNNALSEMMSHTSPDSELCQAMKNRTNLANVSLSVLRAGRKQNKTSLISDENPYFRWGPPLLKIIEASKRETAI